MSDSDKLPSDLKGALLSLSSEDFELAAPAETPRSIHEAIQRVVDGDEIRNNPDLQKSPLELYKKLLKPGLHDAITALGLDPVIQKCKGKLDNAHFDNRARIEKRVTKLLMKAFNAKKVPFKKWAFFPDAMAIEGAANCSGCALLFGTIMNEEFGIETKHANPIGHAANLVTYCDGSIYYVDPRNQVNVRLKLGQPVQNRDGFDIYDISSSNLEYRHLSVAELRHGALLTFLENVNSLKESSDTDEDASYIMDFYKDFVDPGFAEKYMEGNFLDVRESEEMLAEEEKNKQAVRMRRWYHFLLPNH